MTTSTKRIGLFFEAARSEIPTETIRQFATSLNDLLKEFCGGSLKFFIADVKERLDWEL